MSIRFAGKELKLYQSDSLMSAGPAREVGSPSSSTQEGRYRLQGHTPIAPALQSACKQARAADTLAFVWSRDFNPSLYFRIVFLQNLGRETQEMLKNANSP